MSNGEDEAGEDPPDEGAATPEEQASAADEAGGEEADGAEDETVKASPEQEPPADNGEDATSEEGGGSTESTDAEEETDTQSGIEPADPFKAQLVAATEAVDTASGADAGEEELTAALEAIGEALVAAETEANLDEVATALDQAEDAIETADLPEPEDEEEEGPRVTLESRVGELRDELDGSRGPYAEDVVEVLSTAATRIDDTRWTDDGQTDIVEAVSTFVERVNEMLEADIETVETPGSLAGVLSAVMETVGEAGLDPDEDTDSLAALVEASDGLTTDLDDAQEWDDLTTREQLEAEGFYDVLGHVKDYPPEWSALKEHEKRGNVDMILLAMEKLGMDFMEEHCLDALKRMADEGAVEPMLERADRRDRPAIEVLGKIGAEEAVETIVEYVGTDSDPGLEKVTLKALGEIGSESATPAIANRLVAENEIIRSYAARSLGAIGDTRAIEPLVEVLETDTSDTVRASAAWALVQIGTERALEAASDYDDDRAYIVQAEAETAAEALGTTRVA